MKDDVGNTVGEATYVSGSFAIKPDLVDRHCGVAIIQHYNTISHHCTTISQHYNTVSQHFNPISQHFITT